LTYSFSLTASGTDRKSRKGLYSGPSPIRKDLLEVGSVLAPS
jgi:hypothetical protein